MVFKIVRRAHVDYSIKGTLVHAHMIQVLVVITFTKKPYNYKIVIILQIKKFNQTIMYLCTAVTDLVSQSLCTSMRVSLPDLCRLLFH